MTAGLLPTSRGAQKLFGPFGGDIGAARHTAPA
jgi:hypothetical protein